MKPADEKSLYPEVAAWLVRRLGDKYPRDKVAAFDTHKTDLSVFLRKRGLHIHFSDFQAYEIKVDVTGIVERKDCIKLAFVECKTGEITLRDLGQLLGYSLVARPDFSLLLSPQGLSDKLRMLLLAFGRQDVLSYAKNRFIRLGQWNMERRDLDPSTIVPKGSHF